MNLRIRTELSIMMFLEFFIWGAWCVTLSTYLLTMDGFDKADIGMIYSAGPWAAVLSPLFVGMVADRFFSAQKVLGVLHILGAGLMYYASTITEPMMFFWVLLAYALCYMPTLALVNAVAFNQMDNPEKEFPSIRVLGTAGWIVAGLIISAGKWEATVTPLYMASGCSLLMGLYSFLLPKTPPKGAGQKVSVKEILGLDALKLMKDRSFAILIIGSLLVCIPLTFYYNFTNPFLVQSGVTNAAAKQSMGQMSEVIFMLLMPFFLSRLGVKKMLLFGMLAWVARYILFAFGNNEALVFMFYGGILLHGICYDFFFVTGQIYVDNEAPRELRASAQGFLGMMTYGVGMVIGSNVSGLIAKSYETTKMVDGVETVVQNWQMTWLIPAGMAFVVLVAFALLFKDPPKKQAPAEEAAEA